MKTSLEIFRDSIYSIVFHLAPRVANVLLFILIGRQIGALEAGIFTLATTYLLIFSTLSKGLDDLLVREVARLEAGKVANYFANFLLIRLLLTVFLQILLFSLVFYLFNYNTNTTQTILILSLSLIPESVTNVAQSILLAKRHYRAPAIILGLASGLKLAGGVIVILSEGFIVQVAWAMVAGSLLGMFLMLSFAYKASKPVTFQDWINLEPLRKHWQAAIFFISITLLTTLETQTDTILLSLLKGELEVGWYGAATTVAYSLIMFSQAYRYAIYPLMSRYALQAPEKVQTLYKQSLRMMGIIVLPMVSGIIIIAPSLVPLVFGSEFIPTVSILRIISFTLFFMFLNEPVVRIILVHNHQNQIFKFLLLSATLNVSLNLLMIPLLGSNGAAYARVISAFFLFTVCFTYVQRHYFQVNLLKILWKPLLSVSFMITILWFIREQTLILVVAVGIVTYVLGLIMLKEIKRSKTVISLQD